MFHWQSDTFDVPRGSNFLVERRDCINPAFRYHNSLAAQFHLEIDAPEEAKWAQEYRNELFLVKKTAQQVRDECEVQEKTTKGLAHKLMVNFLMEAQ